MTRRWLALASWCGAFAALSSAAALGSCRKPTNGTGNAGSETTVFGDSAPRRAALPAAPVDAGGFVAATGRSCRVMALHGTATATPRFAELSMQPDGGARHGGARHEGGVDEGSVDEGSNRPGPDRGAEDAQAPRPLAQGDLLPAGAIIELGTGAELTAQATVSTREITLVGPATAEACPDGDEAVRLSRGRVTAFPGAGVRPGAEVWIATPLGAVRFSDANIDIAVLGADADRLKVAVMTGRANFVPAAGVVAGDAAGGTMTLSPGIPLDASRHAGPVSRWVRDLVGVCVRQADAAREAAKLVASPRDGGGGSPGDLAFAHVRARQQARAACESAWAAGAVAPGLLDAALRADLEGADATWKGAPSALPHLSSGAPSRAAKDAE